MLLFISSSKNLRRRRNFHLNGDVSVSSFRENVGEYMQILNFNNTEQIISEYINTCTWQFLRVENDIKDDFKNFLLNKHHFEFAINAGGWNIMNEALYEELERNIFNGPEYTNMDQFPKTVGVFIAKNNNLPLIVQH